MKSLFKTFVLIALVTAFLLTGCDTTDASSETSSNISDVFSIETYANLLSDEEALSIANELAEKADDFRLYMYLMAEEFGADLLDGLETFSQDGFLYAEYHLENLLKHLDNKLYYEKFDKETYDFASTQEVYDHIKTFALTSDFTYGVEMVFLDKDDKLFYNTQEMSPMFPGVPQDFTILEKTENQIFFSATLFYHEAEPVEFSIVKNSDGQWRLSKSFFS